MGKREISTWHVAPGVMVPPDRGCSLASACLTCPLPACRHDAPLPRPPVPAPKAERSDRNARVRRRVEELLEAGAQKSAAVRRVAAEEGRSIRTTWKRPVVSPASALAGSADLDSGRTSPEHEGGAVEVERFWAGFREPPAPATSVMVPRGARRKPPFLSHPKPASFSCCGKWGC